MTSEHRPIKQNIDKKGYKLLTTSQVGELLGLAAGTIRNWCDNSRISYTRGEGGRRWISMAEVERLRSDNAYSTVSDAIQRMEAIISERDNELRDLIIEKSSIQAHNFEVINRVVGTHFADLTRRLDHLEQSSGAAKPTINLSESTLRKIARTVLAESARSGDVTPASPPTAPQTKHPDAHHGQPPPGLTHTRVVSEDERNRLIGEGQ